MLEDHCAMLQKRLQPNLRSDAIITRRVLHWGNDEVVCAVMKACLASRMDLVEVQWPFCETRMSFRQNFVGNRSVVRTKVSLSWACLGLTFCP